ncbi:CAP domain-containing protein [Candidatus Nomurabacteria bacterium]|nr:CAP domain-containing protein [Candidatus Nomurabacteria bacterium]
MKKLILAFAIHLVLAAIDGSDLPDAEEPATRAQEVRPKNKYDVGPPDPQEMLELINIERQKVGVAPLVYDESVAKSAQLKADDMVARGYFSHYPKGVDGDVLTADMKQMLAGCTYYGENIHYQTMGTSKQAVEWWTSSPIHYQLLHPLLQLTKRRFTTAVQISSSPPQDKLTKYA